MNQSARHRTVFYFVIMFFICVAPFSQLHAEGDEDGNSNIKGKVITNEGLPAVGVTVTLEGTKRNSITDDDGNFHFKNIAAGDYKIEVHLLGYETIEKDVSVAEGKTTYVDLRLQISEKKLQEVIITGNRYKLTTAQSDYVAKIPLKDLENSQVYTTLTKDLLKQQMVYSVDNAVSNAAGIQPMWDATGRAGD